MSGLPSYAARVAAATASTAAAASGGSCKKGEAGVAADSGKANAAARQPQPASARMRRFQQPSLTPPGPAPPAHVSGSSTPTPAPALMEKAVPVQVQAAPSQGGPTPSGSVTNLANAGPSPMVKHSWSNQQLPGTQVVVVSSGSPVRAPSASATNRGSSQTPGQQTPVATPVQQGGDPGSRSSSLPRAGSMVMLPAAATRAVSPRGLPQGALVQSPRVGVMSPTRVLSPGRLMHASPGSPSASLEALHPRLGTAERPVRQAPAVVLAPRFALEATALVGAAGAPAGAPAGTPPAGGAHGYDELLQLLERERRERTAEIAALRRGLEAQRQALSEVAGGEMQASLKALTDNLAEAQRQQELQAGALRDGLMEIHEQRNSITRLLEEQRGALMAGATDKAAGDNAAVNDVPDGDQEATGCSVISAVSDSTAPKWSQRENGQWVRTPRCQGMECEACFAKIDALSERLSLEISEVLKHYEELADNFEAERKERTEALEAEREERASEVAQVRALCARSPKGGSIPDAADVWKLHEKLSEELVAVGRRGEQERADLAQAIENERAVRQGDVAMMRSRFDCDLADVRSALNRIAADGTLPVQGAPSATPVFGANQSAAEGISLRSPSVPLEPREAVRPLERPTDTEQKVEASPGGKKKLFSMDKLLDFDARSPTKLFTGPAAHEHTRE